MYTYKCLQPYTYMFVVVYILNEHACSIYVCTHVHAIWAHDTVAFIWAHDTVAFMHCGTSWLQCVYTHMCVYIHDFQVNKILKYLKQVHKYACLQWFNHEYACLQGFNHGVLDCTSLHVCMHETKMCMLTIM